MHRAAVLPNALNGGFVVRVGEVHRVVDVDASTSTGDAHLWTPEADSRPVAGHEPDGVTMRPSLDDGKAEHIEVELLGRLQVYDFEDQLADACHGNTGAHTDSQRPPRFPASVMLIALEC